ncbi:hypothetical protein [Pseudomonas sp. HMWF021]|uniref:hypothetical protein n=1 Tax=Pseudomonas sp. HMWF021 TaxID=2056857 RepID=UPI000D357F91|nr:hypothetical protein [Pseudomonas sp. HMWF021]PTT24770.1 hypothetical protein DBR18_26700 [Pseudomonas sp. HMWF021]
MQEEITTRFQQMLDANKNIGLVAPGPAGAVMPCQTTWVGIELRRSDGLPVPRAEYVLTLPDGSKRHGMLDEKGYAVEKDVGEAGQCHVYFPNVEFP